MNPIFCRILPIASIILIFLYPAAGETGAPQTRRMQYSLDIQDFSWSEYDDQGFKLLEESGYLYGFSADLEDCRRFLGWRTGVSFFGGEVDYDGVTWSLTPVKTDVMYLGGQIFADIVPNYRLDGGLWLKTFMGMGAKGWLRHLDDTQTQEGVFVSGAEENWLCVYGRAGAGASYPLFNNVEFFLEAGAKIPVYTINHAHMYVFGNPSVDLKPDMRISPFADAGVRWNQVRVRFTYDPLWFNASDAVGAGSYVLQQPESKAKIYKLTAAWELLF